MYLEQVSVRTKLVSSRLSGPNEFCWHRFLSGMIFSGPTILTAFRKIGTIVRVCDKKITTDFYFQTYSNMFPNPDRANNIIENSIEMECRSLQSHTKSLGHHIS